MFFKKKEDKKALPDLPPSPTLPLPKLGIVPLKVPNKEESSIMLASSIPELKKPSISTVKEPEEEEFTEKDEDTIPPSKSFKAVEMEEWSSDTEERKIKPSKAAKIDKAPDMEEREIPLRREISSKAQDKNAEIFVKLDKFRNARRALEEIKIRTEEIDALLKKIRETKLREEQELSGWEREIANVKAKVQDVSSNIFEKVE